VNEETRNSPLDVCRVLGIALLSDSKIDDREIEALAEMRIGEKLGVSAADFRKVIHGLCKGALFDDAGRPNASVTELGAISEMAPLLGRETPADRESLARLVELINQADPTLISDQLLDKERLNAALDRIDDPRLQIWTSCVLVRLVRADGNLDSKEKLLVSHILNRWGIKPEAIAS